MYKIREKVNTSVYKSINIKKKREAYKCSLNTSFKTKQQALVKRGKRLSLQQRVKTYSDVSVKAQSGYSWILKIFISQTIKGSNYFQIPTWTHRNTFIYSGFWETEKPFQICLPTRTDSSSLVWGEKCVEGEKNDLQIAV